MVIDISGGLAGKTHLQTDGGLAGQLVETRLLVFIREYESGKATRLTEDGNGSLIFEKNTSLSPEIVRWVLNYGSGAEVLEPVELRDMLKAEIVFMATMYP